MSYNFDNAKIHEYPIPKNLVLDFYDGRNRLRQINVSPDDVQQIYFIVGLLLSTLLDSTFASMETRSIHIHLDTYKINKSNF